MIPGKVKAPYLSCLPKLTAPFYRYIELGELDMIRLLRKVFGNSRQRISSSGRTDTGRVRGHNEDNFCILADRKVFVVADGMGGHNAGEVASQIAIETLDKYLTKDAIRKLKGNRVGRGLCLKC